MLGEERNLLDQGRQYGWNPLSRDTLSWAAAPIVRESRTSNANDPKLLATERALRGIALGRNHYGSRSERGTRVAALCYTLLESAKLASVEPARYLAEATRRAIVAPGTVTLPRDLAGV